MSACTSQGCWPVALEILQPGSWSPSYLWWRPECVGQSLWWFWWKEWDLQSLFCPGPCKAFPFWLRFWFWSHKYIYIYICVCVCVCHTSAGPCRPWRWDETYLKCSRQHMQRSRCRGDVITLGRLSGIWPKISEDPDAWWIGSAQERMTVYLRVWKVHKVSISIVSLIITGRKIQNYQYLPFFSWQNESSYRVKWSIHTRIYPDIVHTTWIQSPLLADKVNAHGASSWQSCGSTRWNSWKVCVLCVIYTIWITMIY